MTTYRVHFPGLTQNLYRDFTDRTEAKFFANKCRNDALHMWRHVCIEIIEG